MNATTNPIDVRATAAAVMSALADLHGYLSAAINPDRVALADLEMEPMGWTKKVYSPKAFEIWQNQLKLFPNDPLILHHMAIMHHARAFDLEAGPKPSESDADWTTAIGYWHRLHGLDAFWENLTAKACAGTARQDIVKKLRADFPQKALAIHYDIALDPETRQKRKARAKFHIAMAQKAPFDATQRTEAQRAAYNRYIKVIPDEVWQPNELREEMLGKGQNAIVEYLDFDPGCVPALEDALRLQRRVQRSRNTAWQAMNEKDPRRRALLLLEKKDAEAWRPFFDQLAAVADRLDEDVRDDLAGWYHGRGNDLRALDENEMAIEFFERAVSVCRTEDDGRKSHVRDLVQTMANVAREKAYNEDAGAIAYCDKLRKRDDLTVIACWLLAQAFTRLSSYDIALALCDRGLAIEPDFDQLDADEWVGRLSEFKLEIPIHKFMAEARDALKAGNPKNALNPLNQAEKLAKSAGTLKQHNSIYWLRAQTHLALDQIAAGKRDLESYLGLLDSESSPSDIKAGKELREMVAQKERMSNIQPLLDKAKHAMEGGRSQDALTLLDEAAKKAPRMDVIFFLRAQVLCSLGRIADAKRDVKTVAELAETEEDTKHLKQLQEMVVPAEAATAIRCLLEKAKAAMDARRFEDALPPLNEAAKKSPRNDVVYFLRAQVLCSMGRIADAKRDVKTVAELAETEEDRKHVRGLEEMIAHAETAGAIQGLLEKAKAAMEAGRFEDALPSLNEAAKKSPRTDVIFFLRAQANMALGKVADAKRDAETVADLAETDVDLKNALRLDEMIKEAESAGAVRSLLEQAQAAMQNQEFSQAVRYLNDAAKKSPDTSVIYFLRAQANMGSHDMAAAASDVMKFERLATTLEEKTAAKRLKQGLFGGNM